MLVLDELHANLGYEHDIGLVFFRLVAQKTQLCAENPIFRGPTENKWKTVSFFALHLLNF